MRIHAGMHGETRGKKGRKRGRFQEDEKEGKKTGKMDTGKQQKGGRFREKGKIWTEGEDWQPHTRETRNDQSHWQQEYDGPGSLTGQ